MKTLRQLVTRLKNIDRFNIADDGEIYMKPNALFILAVDVDCIAEELERKTKTIDELVRLLDLEIHTRNLNSDPKTPGACGLCGSISCNGGCFK